jgi:hypothetical protein
MTLHNAMLGATLAVQEFHSAYLFKLARSYRDGWRRPASSWSDTGSVLSAQHWSDQAFTEHVDKAVLELDIVWVNTHEAPFTFPGDPLVGDLQSTLYNYLSRALLPQTKRRKSGVWKSRDGERDRRILRYPWRGGGNLPEAP